MNDGGSEIMLCVSACRHRDDGYHIIILCNKRQRRHALLFLRCSVRLESLKSGYPRQIYEKNLKRRNQRETRIKFHWYNIYYIDIFLHCYNSWYLKYGLVSITYILIRMKSIIILIYFDEIFLNAKCEPIPFMFTKKKKLLRIIYILLCCNDFLIWIFESVVIVHVYLFEMMFPSIFYSLCNYLVWILSKYN